MNRRCHDCHQPAQLKLNGRYLCVAHFNKRDTEER